MARESEKKLHKRALTARILAQTTMARRTHSPQNRADKRRLDRPRSALENNARVQGGVGFSQRKKRKKEKRKNATELGVCKAFDTAHPPGSGDH
jgi:hypothetical protein